MFCPSCGQERLSQATKFCSRCGYLLTGTEQLLHIGGELPTARSGKNSAKWTGVKHGIFLILLAAVLVPLLGLLLTFGFGMRNPWPIGLVLFLGGGAGVLRIAYALMFESGNAATLPSAGENQYTDHALPGTGATTALPPQQTPSAADYISPGVGGWRDTNELEPASVTDNTTKLLEKEAE